MPSSSDIPSNADASECTVEDYGKNIPPEPMPVSFTGTLSCIKIISV